MDGHTNKLVLTEKSMYEGETKTMHIGEYTQRRGHTKECIHGGEEDYTRRKNYTRRGLNTDQYRWWSVWRSVYKYTRRELNIDSTDGGVYGGVYTWRSVYMEECIHGRVYTWRNVYMEECIHRGVYPWRNVHMEECTHRGVYAWKSVYTRGRLNTKKNTYRKEYTQKIIYAGESECGGRGVHAVQCIHGGESTRGEHTWRST